MQAIRSVVLFFIIAALSLSETFGQCGSNTIAFVGGQPTYNNACGDNSYQVIKGSNVSGSGHIYRWEVSFSGAPYTKVVDASDNEISTSDLSKNAITDFILTPNANASGDYKIRRIVTDVSPSCSSTSEPVYLYYSLNASSISGGVISGEPTSCSPADGTLIISGNTGPVLQWEWAPSSSGPWIPVDPLTVTTNTLAYSNLIRNRRAA